MGKTIELTWSDTSLNANGSVLGTLTTTANSRVVGPVPWPQSPTGLATETVTEGAITGSLTPSAYRTVEHRLYGADAEFTAYDMVTTSTGTVGTASTALTRIIYTPPFVDTSPGMEEDVPRDMGATLSFENSFNGGPPSRFTSTQWWTVVFRGVERLTVPAGTFNACRFEQTPLGGGAMITQWLLVGHGIVVREVQAPDAASGGARREATWLRINGEPAR